MLAQFQTHATANTQSLTSFLIIAYTPPDTFSDELTDDRARQARKVAERPELRIISRAGEELAADALSVAGFEAWGCNDYVLAAVGEEEGVGVGTRTSRGTVGGAAGGGRCYVVLSPRDLVVVRPRDRRDHVAWLMQRTRYEEALEEAERIEAEAGTGVGTGGGADGEDPLSSSQIGQRYIEHLVNEGATSSPIVKT